MDDGSDKKKAKGTKKCVIKRGLMFENTQINSMDDKNEKNQKIMNQLEN